MAYRIGLIGNRAHQNTFGPVWHNHPDCEIVAAAEHHVEKGRALKDLYGVDVATDYDAVLENPDVDIVSICTDFYLKRPLIQKAVANGKHVLVDKPLGRTVTDAQEIVAAVSGADVKVLLGYPLRFMPAMMRLKKAIDHGEFGHVVAYAHNSVKQFEGNLMDYVSYPTPMRQNGGGELMNLGSHAVDYMYWLFGLPNRILCRMHNVYFEEYKAFGSEDIATLWCEYDEMVATLTLGRSQAKGTGVEADAINVTGNGVAAQVTRKSMVVNGESVAVEPPAERMLVPCVQHLLDCIEQDLEPITGVHNGLAVMQIKMAAYQSAQSRKIVELPLQDVNHPLIDASEQTLDILLD